MLECALISSILDETDRVALKNDARFRFGDRTVRAIQVGHFRQSVTPAGCCICRCALPRSAAVAERARCCDELRQSTDTSRVRSCELDAMRRVPDHIAR